MRPAGCFGRTRQHVGWCMHGMPRWGRALSTGKTSFATAALREQRPSVTIVGGGAAGLTAAFFAAEQGVQVTVLERTKEAGKKILMSGGTRCNVLPMEVDLQRDFFSESPAGSVRAVLQSWPLAACRAWLEDPDQGVGLELHEEEDTSKVFPASNSGKDVRDALVAACVRRGVRMRYGASLEGLSRMASPTDASESPAPSHTSSQGGGWVCHLADGSTHHTDRLVLATGGFSFPAVGTDGTGHKILKSLGVTLHEPYPALTPLTGSHPGKTQLAGVSLYNVDLAVKRPGVKKARRADRTGMLFTHKGYSGPAVLDVSHHVIVPMMRGGTRPAVTVNWTGESQEVWETRLKGQGTAQVATVLQRCGLRERLADALCAELGLEKRRLCELRKEERQALITKLTAYELQYTGHEGYKKAEVTGGGVPLTAMCTRTLECKALPGVHIAGELLDVFGRIGGFNFLWAWVSGRLAGKGAALAALADQQQQQQQQQQPGLETAGDSAAGHRRHTAGTGVPAG